VITEEIALNCPFPGTESRFDDFSTPALMRSIKFDCRLSTCSDILETRIVRIVAAVTCPQLMVTQMTKEHLAVALTLVTAFVYSVGFVYLYNYHNFFGIDMLEVGPSIQNTLIFALPSFVHLFSPKGELYVFVPSAVVLAIVYFALLYVGKFTGANGKVARWTNDNKNDIAWSALAIFAMLVLVESYRSAESLARTNAVEIWMNDSNPAFLEFARTADAAQARKVSSTTEKGLPKKLEAFNDELQLRFILSTSQFHYLFTRADCDLSANETCEGFLFRVRVADVNAVTILHPGEGKK
jgi:hypothetical protein